MTIKSNFFALKRREQKFFQVLVGFGGACTSAEIKKGLGISDRSNLHKKILFFIQKGFLVQHHIGPPKKFPTIYFPSIGLGALLGCERRVSADLKYIVEKCFRFSVALENSDDDLSGAFFNKNPPELGTPSLQDVWNHRRDEVILDDTVIIDLQPYWSKEKIKNRVAFWMKQDSKLKFEMWAPTESFLHWLVQNLPSEMLSRTTRMTALSNALSTKFCRICAEDLICKIE